ncbi:hypothetical protein J2125_000051 [Erwinia toletana]|uniref:Uncharacterized protein n=1 Tax=Winslowiella toletana TaxID=92490 RepID=A0ABS4P2H3_9GAMM|nr:hypothetical protein [Winslowiella toletana]MBP2166859.1 hypothetical protein [Winslowiella toletana]
MFEQALIRKPQQVRDMKSGYCKSNHKADEDVCIPDSWSLSNLQRSFIESMIDDKKSK